MTDELFSADVFRLDEPLPEVRHVETERIHEPADQYPVITFKVYGLAKPQGSKKPIISKTTGKAFMVESSGKAHTSYRQDVAAAAEAAMAGHLLLVGGVRLTVDFVFPRPKGHLRRDGSVLPSAPDFPDTRSVGDTSKLVRSIEDSMSSIVYRDDSQVTTILARKRYGVAIGTFIRVEPDIPGS